MGYRVGVDVGGTFTDLICITPTGDVVLDKTPTTLENQSVGVMIGLGQLAEQFNLSREEFCSELDIFVHGTTTADNTMIEMNGAATGLLVTEGHRDEIEMRRVHKEKIWDPSYPAPTPIAKRRARIAIPERMDAAGSVLLPLDEEAVRVGTRRLRALGVESVAIMFLFSYVNPQHELRAAQIVREEFPDVAHISLSHDVMSRGPEFERVSTTLVNAYVAPRISSYIDQLKTSLLEAKYTGPLLIMQSTGGVMPPDYVAKRAVSLLGSGPTGGVMGSALAAQVAEILDFVSVDMGGTSFDVCLVRGGRPEIKTDWNWRYRYYIGLPMVDVQSVGAGGGSIARVRQGALLVGPESAGSNPGPVCYQRGGVRPTVTDADAVLGYLPLTSFANGRMELDVDGARAAIEREVAEPLKIDATEAAWGIERIVNSNMANETRRVLAAHGTDPRMLSMIAYGGNGAVHAWAIAQELGIKQVVIPKAAPAFSALGVLIADYVIDIVRAYVIPLAQIDLNRVESLIRDLHAEVDQEIAPLGLSSDDIDLGVYAQMCYPGQNFDMSVPLSSETKIEDATLIDLAERFHDQHEAERGFSFKAQAPILRGLRLAARGCTPKPDRLAEMGVASDASKAQSGTRAAYFGDGFIDTPVYEGRQLGAGAKITGPALIEEPFTVVVVPPGGNIVIDKSGNYLLKLK